MQSSTMCGICMGHHRRELRTARTTDKARPMQVTYDTIGGHLGEIQNATDRSTTLVFNYFLLLLLHNIILPHTDLGVRKHISFMVIEHELKARPTLTKNSSGVLLQRIGINGLSQSNRSHSYL